MISCAVGNWAGEMSKPCRTREDGFGNFVARSSSQILSCEVNLCMRVKDKKKKEYQTYPVPVPRSATAVISSLGIEG